MQERPNNNNNNNLENEVNVLTRLVNDREQPNPIWVNRNQNVYEVLVNMQRNHILGGQNGPDKDIGTEAIQNR